MLRAVGVGVGVGSRGGVGSGASRGWEMTRDSPGGTSLDLTECHLGYIL